jgi:hypothetical protein
MKKHMRVSFSRRRHDTIDIISLRADSIAYKNYVRLSVI